MATTNLKGIVKDVLPVEFYGDGNTGRRQTLVLFIPGYVDNYGVKKGQDELWGIDIYNKKIDEFGLNSNCVSKRADIEVYVSGKEFDKKDGSGKWYGISATLKSIKLGESVQIPQTAGSASDDGDLPF